MVAALNEAGFSGPPKRMRIGPVVDQPSSAFRPAWLGMRPFAGWMLMVPSVVPEKYRSFGNGKMPCAGWYSAAVAAGVEAAAPPEGLPLPTVGSVGVTSGGLSTELEQPAVTITARAVAAISLFMRSLLGILFGRVGRIPSPCRTMRRTCRIRAVAYAWAPKGGKPSRQRHKHCRNQEAAEKLAPSRGPMTQAVVRRKQVRVHESCASSPADIAAGDCDSPPALRFVPRRTVCGKPCSTGCNRVSKMHVCSTCLQAVAHSGSKPCRVVPRTSHSSKKIDERRRPSKR